MQSETCLVQFLYSVWSVNLGQTLAKASPLRIMGSEGKSLCPYLFHTSIQECISQVAIWFQEVTEQSICAHVAACNHGQLSSSCLPFTGVLYFNNYVRSQIKECHHSPHTPTPSVTHWHHTQITPRGSPVPSWPYGQLKVHKTILLVLEHVNHTKPLGRLTFHETPWAFAI